MCRCVSATGCDIKAFCVGPIYALVQAVGLVKSGLFKRIVVVGGGSAAKLGMKFRGHLAKDMPILEDVLGGLAFLVVVNDGESPLIRLDSIGRHNIGSGSSQQSIMESLVVRPLHRMGKKITDVDRYAVELQNPEVTVSAGSGNVPLTNYRMIGALAVLGGEIQRGEIDRFVLEHGMPGFSPTQGHIPAAVPFLGHAIDAIKRGGNKERHVCCPGQSLSREDDPAFGRPVISYREESGKEIRRGLNLSQKKEGMSAMFKGKKVIVFGERDGVPGPAIAACMKAAGAEVVLTVTECFV
jgi:betaine reductase